MRANRHVVGTAVAAILSVLLTAGFQPSAGAAGSDTAAAIDWSPCHRNLGYPFECARVRVPLDYANPHGATISLALARLPASDPTHRIGSLFINPGGPGGSGVDVVLGAAPFLYGGAIQDRFDIVGFDPRGIMRSAGLRCFDDPSQWGPLFLPYGFPLTHHQEQQWRRADQYLVDACAARGGPILDHMSTADAARDMDQLRAAVGDEQLTYLGVSYGSFLGVTYANLFPDRVRAVIVDGVLDPIAWTTGVDGERHTVPFSTRLRSDMGAQATLDQFFTLCDAGWRRCAFAPHSADRFARLARKLLKGPITVVDPRGNRFHFRYQDLIGITLNAMYDSFLWRRLARFLADIEAQANPARLGRALDALQRAERITPAGGAGPYPNFPEGFPGVACSDSDNPVSYSAWHEQGAIADERFGYFGRLWTWLTSICARWPGFDEARYMGPFDARTANPVLVIGNLYDPATRYQGAQIVHQLLPKSALLTVNGWGHTSLFLSRCADRVSVAYLLRGATPAPGKVCNQDQVPFTSGAGVDAADRHRAAVIGRLLPWDRGRSGSG
jgi:pimeloyl-ACP methyl ester carboxylesterase